MASISATSTNGARPATSVEKEAAQALVDSLGVAELFTAALNAFCKAPCGGQSVGGFTTANGDVFGFLVSHVLGLCQPWAAQNRFLPSTLETDLY